MACRATRFAVIWDDPGGMSRDPRHGSTQEPARDVLAAEAFAVPAADPELRSGRLELPEDPTGIAEAHDILAAEEFAMPAAGPAGSGGSAGPQPETQRRVAAVALFVGFLAARRLRRRRS
jgi:hypothetical protein